MKISKRIAAFLLAATLAVSSGVTSAFAMTDQEFRDSLQRQIDAANKIAENDPATQAMKKEMEERERQEALNNPQNPNKIDNSAARIVPTTPIGERTKALYMAEGWNYNESRDAFNIQNKEREKAGLEPLVWSDDLYRLACARAIELTEKYGHPRPTDNLTVADSDQYGMGRLGENIGDTVSWRDNVNSKTDAQCKIDSWMDSDGHRANILNQKYQSGAIACYTNGNGNYANWAAIFSFDSNPVATSRPEIQHKDGTTTELPDDAILTAGPTKK